MSKLKIMFFLFILSFITIDLASQNYPSIENSFKSELSEYLIHNNTLDSYDFVILKYKECYWFKNTHHKLICFNGNSVDLIEIIKKKKNNRYKYFNRKRDSKEKYIQLIDSLNQLGLFKLKEEDLNTEIQMQDGNSKVLNISDGIVQTIEVYHKNNSWELSVYEAKRYFEFCQNENLILFDKNNSRFSSKFKDCSPHQHFCSLMGKCHSVGHYSYTHRWHQGGQQNFLLKHLLFD